MNCLRLFSNYSELEAYVNSDEYVIPNVAYETDTEVIVYSSDRKIERIVTIQTLIDEGYLIENPNAGNSMQFKSNCPYAIEEITDFEEYFPTKEFVWSEELPAKFDAANIAARYANITVPHPPKGGMFWGLDMSSIDTMNITFNCNVDYNASDYPWGSGSPNGIFAERYTAGGYLVTPSPKNINVTFNGYYTSVMNSAFCNLTNTESLSIVCLNGWGASLSAHDWSGAFEGCSNLKTLYMDNVRYNRNGMCFDNITHLCSGCVKLESFPIGTRDGGAYNRDSEMNTITPGIRTGYGSVVKAFYNCNNLRVIEPTLDFRNVTSAGDGDASNYSCFVGCNVLEDLQLKNLMIDWDFSGNSYLSKASIEYMLNNIGDVSGKTVTFSNRYEDTISSDAIAAAKAKGWTVVFA